MSSPQRKFIPLIFLFLVFSALGAQGAPGWREMEEGKGFFRERMLDKALYSFKRASELRKTAFREAAGKLDVVMSSPEAKAAKDDLWRLVWSLAARDLKSGEVEKIKEKAGSSLAQAAQELISHRISDLLQNLVEALRMALSLGGQEGLGNSLSSLERHLEGGGEYPESEFWIGKVYMSEGEYELAERQFSRALELASAQADHEAAIEYRYQLAELHLRWRDVDKVERGKHLNDLEKNLLAIIAYDPLWSDPEEENLRLAMEKSLQREGIDRFLTLYRHEGAFAVRAYSILGELASKQGRHAKAMPYLMLAALSAASGMAAELSDDDPTWAFSGLVGFLSEVEADPEARSYADEVKFQAILYYLGLSLFKDGRDKAGREIMSILAKGKGEWAALAASGIWAKPALQPEADPEILF